MNLVCMVLTINHDAFDVVFNFKGTMTFTNGDIYEGAYADGKRSGKS